MPNLLNFTPSALGHVQAELAYAEVVAPAPTSFSDPLFLVLPDWSRDFPIAIPDWPACHGVTLPLVDDAALLVTDVRGFRRCVWWDGLMTFSTQSSQNYYLTTTASDAALHTKMTGAPFSPKTAVPFLGLTNGQLLLDYVSEPGIPGRTYLPAGQFEFHIHAQQTAGNQAVQVYAEFWEYDPAGATHVAMIGRTHPSKSLTLEEVEYRLFFATSNVYIFASVQNRIAVHVYVLVGGGGGANVSYFVGGTADSHVTVPASATSQVTSSSWIAPSLVNSWANSGGGYEVAGYLKDPFGFVHLRGVVTGGATGTVAFTLPVGYRPGATTLQAVGNDPSTSGANAQIAASGTVTIRTGTTANVGMSGITFLAEN